MVVRSYSEIVQGYAPICDAMAKVQWPDRTYLNRSREFNYNEAFAPAKATIQGWGLFSAEENSPHPLFPAPLAKKQKSMPRVESDCIKAGDSHLKHRVTHPDN